MRAVPIRTGVLLAGFALALSTQLPAQDLNAPPNALEPDYSMPAKAFPRVLRPYQYRPVPDAVIRNSPNAALEVHDGKLPLTLTQLVAAVVANNLAVASARYYPAAAQTDLLRARSGQSPRGVDQAVIPSGIFSGAVGGSILGGAGGGGGGGASNAGGITGNATQVTLRPSGVFDPSLTVNFSLDRTLSPLSTTVVAGVSSVTTHTAATSLSYTQAFPTGTSLGISYSTQRQLSTQHSLLFNPDFTSGITASVTQQLLNGFGTKVNGALIKVAENEQGIERESFRQSLIAAIASAENAYWDLIAARESVRATEQALSVAQQLFNNNRRAFEAGVMARLDVVNAQSQVAASQRDLVIAQTNLQFAELQVKNLISTNLDEPLASAAIDTPETFPEPGDDRLPGLDEAVAIAQKNRPEISIAQGNIKSQQDALPFIENELLPNLNVFALVSTAGLYNGFGTAFAYDWEFKYPQFAAGISLNFSLRNRQAQADNIRSRLEMRQSEDTLVRSERQVRIDVQNALIAATQGRAQVQAAHEAVVLEQQKTDAERKKLAVGLSTSYNVILVERDFFTAQLAEVQARDTYAKAKVALESAMGVTLTNQHIDLDEAMKGRLKISPAIQ